MDRRDFRWNFRNAGYKIRMIFTPDFLLQLFIACGAAVAVYAGIKSDLAVTRSRADTAIENASLAHRRIDDFYKELK